METKERIREILCIIFSFLLSVMLFATTFAITAKLTLLYKDYFANAVEKSGYIDLLREELINELANQGYISGFDEAFFEQIISADMVRIPVLSAVDKIYGTGDYKEVPKDKLAEILKNAFVDNLESREVEVDDEQKKHLEDFAEECAEFFAANARLPFISVSESIVKTAIPLVKCLLAFLGTLILFCLVLIAFTSPKSEGAIRYYSYSFGGAALMTATPVIAVMATGIFKKISIADKALYYLVQTVATDFLNIVLITATVFGLIWIVTALLVILKKNKQPRKAVTK